MLGVWGQRSRGLGAELPAARGLREDQKNLAIFNDLCLFQRGELCCGSGQRPRGLSYQPPGVRKKPKNLAIFDNLYPK